MEKDICEPYRALKDGLKAVRNSEVKIIFFSLKNYFRLFGICWASPWQWGTSWTGARRPPSGSRCSRSSPGCGTLSTGSRSSTMLFRGAQDLLLLGNWFFWLGSEKVPGVAAQPWQLVAGAEGPRPGRPHWLWGASDQPQQNGGASLHILNYFDKHKVECRSSLGYLHLSHSYCSATRALITSFLEVLPNLQMFPHISHFIFTKPPHAPKRFTFKTSHMQINCLSAFIVFLIHATLAHWHICTGSSQGFAIYQGGNSTRRGVWIF